MEYIKKVTNSNFLLFNDNFIKFNFNQTNNVVEFLKKIKEELLEYSKNRFCLEKIVVNKIIDGIFLDIIIFNKCELKKYALAIKLFNQISQLKLKINYEVRKNYYFTDTVIQNEQVVAIIEELLKKIVNKEKIYGKK